MFFLGKINKNTSPSENPSPKLSKSRRGEIRDPCSIFDQDSASCKLPKKQLPEPPDAVFLFGGWVDVDWFPGFGDFSPAWALKALWEDL